MAAHTAKAADAPASEAHDREAYAATLGLPVLILVAAAIGFYFSDPVSGLSSWINPMLGFVMFSMGLTLRPIDFALVAKRPVAVIIGVAAQFVIMPLAAVIVVRAVGLPDEVAAGVILVGCAPGGTASNVVSFLARGDVALSVAMTSVSTLVAPALTPVLTWWLAGKYMPVSIEAMAMSIVQIVFLPVLAGLVVRRLLDRPVRQVLPALPWISVALIAFIVMVVVSTSGESLLTAGPIVVASVIIHNAIGLGLGYLVGIITGQPVASRRTIAIEVGMQNSGLAAGLASQYMSPLAALPAAVFSVWHNLSGAIVAALCRRWDRRRRGTVSTDI